MANYSPQRASAYSLIKRKGQPMTLYRVTVPNYNPLNPETTGPIVDSQSDSHGVVLPASQGTIEAFDKRILDDPQQRMDFRFVILAGLGLTIKPQAQDILRTAEGLYRVLGATPLDPDGAGSIIFSLGCTIDPQLAIP